MSLDNSCRPSKLGIVSSKRLLSQGTEHSECRLSLPVDERTVKVSPGPLMFPMSYQIGRLWFVPRRLSASKAIALIQRLNRQGTARYRQQRIRGTEADPELVREVVDRYGEFRLCLIPYEYLRGKVCGNRARIEVVEELFRKNHNTLSKIPPIMIRGYEQELVLLDGHARAEVAFRLHLPLLGYVPERLIPLVRGLTII